VKPLFDPAKLIFIPEPDHCYTYDGRQFVSVTQALTMTGFIDSKWFTQESRDRGTYVHEATVMIDEGTLNWDALHPDLVPYCRAYEWLIGIAGFKVLASEMRVAHPQYLYAGTLDRIGELNGKLVLIDIKSGGVSAWAALQTAAYADCFSEPMERYALCLPSNGPPRLSEPYKNKMDVRVFRAAVTCANWQRKQGVKS